MTIVQVTTHEGGLWKNIEWDTAQYFIDNLNGEFAAIRFGDNIYDFVLARLGQNPWRRRRDLR